MKLDVPQDRVEDLLETIEQFKEAANHVSKTAWNREGLKETNKNILHRETYEEVREATDLPANLVQSARNVAAEAVKSGVEKLKKGEKTSRPIFTSDVARYDKRVLTDFQDHYTLATVNGRVEAQYILPDDEDAPHHRYLLNPEYEFRTATLHRRDGDFYLHITLLKTVEGLEKPENGTVLGVDLNIDGHLAVTSTGGFFGNADLLNHERNTLEKRRGSLQRTGTRNAHLTVKSIGSRFRNWTKNYLHQVSKNLVQEAIDHGADIIAVENLKNIRERMSNGSKFQQWTFKELQRQIQYKAEAEGMSMKTVDSAYTSQQCSHTNCGFTHENNRDGDEFKCQKCGKSLHADYNAARNIGMKYVRNRLKSGSERATCQLALKSGTMTPNRGYTPYPSGSEAENTDKPLPKSPI